MQENQVNEQYRPGECPEHLEMVPDYECEACWDRGCDICTIIDPTTGALIPVKQFDEEVYESEMYDMDELCLECHDPDCEGCNE